MTYHMKLNQITTHTITTSDTTQFQFYKLFIGLKNASQNFDTYRIYINHNQVYSQTDSIYEQALVTSMKPKSEMYRHHMYTLLNEAHKHSKNVCGVYVPINSNLGQEFDLTFEVAIQLDDLLPLSGMSILPNWVIGDIELEIRNRIQGNLVYCQVDPNVLIEEKRASSIINNQSDAVELFDIAETEASRASYIKEFTQVGE